MFATEELADPLAWRFPDVVANDGNRFGDFLQLAREASAPHVIAASLQALARQLERGAAMPDGAALGAVIERDARARDARVAARALVLAKTALRRRVPLSTLPELLASLGDEPRFSDGAGRLALLDVIRAAERPSQSVPMMSLLFDSVAAKAPYVESNALQTLAQFAPQISDRPRLLACGLIALEDDDAGVRGRGLDLLGATWRGYDPSIISAVYERLDDPSPHVRSKACLALARMKYAPAIHRIVDLLGDASINSYGYDEMPALEGGPSKQVLTGSPWGSVQDAAVLALHTLAGDSLDLIRVTPENAPKDIAHNAALTRAWYQRERAGLPRDVPL
jgi:hypothetical protein